MFLAGFDLITHDSYFTILVEVFTSHILSENTYLFHKSYGVNRTHDFSLKTYKQVPCKNT